MFNGNKKGNDLKGEYLLIFHVKKLNKIVVQDTFSYT